MNGEEDVCSCLALELARHAHEVGLCVHNESRQTFKTQSLVLRAGEGKDLEQEGENQKDAEQDREQVRVLKMAVSFGRKPKSTRVWPF